MASTHVRPDGKPHERLHAWVSCHELALFTYRLTQSWPSDERYGLVTQARRAAFSAPANICEGAARCGPKEFRRFLDVSIGSLAELSYILRLAGDLGYLTKEQLTEVEILRDHATRLTWGLYEAIGRAAKQR
ncbi:MAG TPA: four helix bundle protein [Gemmatimonadales bacterium]